VAETAQGLKGQGANKEVFLPKKSWFFTFIHFYFFAYGST
jgi:hypothetical protein